MLWHGGRERTNSDGPIKCTSGRSGSGETRNFGVRAKVRVVRARGSTNGMVFTNANKHSYQLQNDSRPQSAYRPSCRTARSRRDVSFLHASHSLVVLSFLVEKLLITRIPAKSRWGDPWPFPLARLRKYLTLKIQRRKRTTSLRITGRRPCENRIALRADAIN